MGKLISWISLGFLLVAAPLVSWYYLKSGLEYRKDIQRNISIKDSISIELDTLKIFNNKASLIVVNNTNDIEESIKSILKQFEETKRFQIYSFDSIPNTNFLPYDKNYIFQNNNIKGDLVLLDENYKIRSEYIGVKDSIKVMISHIAIVIPKDKSPDIEFKQNN